MLKAVFVAFLLQISGYCFACSCDGPLYFLKVLNYDYVCHIKIIKQYPGISQSGNYEGLTKVVVLNSRKFDQINDTLFYLNSSPSLCGQTIGHFQEGQELIIKAMNDEANFARDYFFENKTLLYMDEILAEKSIRSYKSGQNNFFEFKYNTVASSSCDQVILKVDKNWAVGRIDSQRYTFKYIYYNFLSIISEKYKISASKLNYENQKMKIKTLLKKLKFKKI
jgi:hypothetical protein